MIHVLHSYTVELITVFLPQCPSDCGSPHSVRPGSSSPSSAKKGLKIPKHSKKRSSLSSSGSSITGTSSSLSTSSKAKRSLFPDETKGSVSSQDEDQGDCVVDDMSPSPVERKSRRQGSLLELQGKIGVL